MSVTNLFNDDDPTIANRYLAGQLTDAEQAVFETRLETSATTLQELEATARLKVGLERLRETGQLDDMLRSTPPIRQILVGLAATVALAVIALSFLLGHVGESAKMLIAASPTSFVDPQGSALSVAATFAVFRKRAGEYDAVIELPPARNAIALRVLPQVAAPTERYRVSLARIRDDGSLEPSQSVADLTPAADGFVTVFADSALLTPGRYRMAVSSTAPNADPVTTETFVLSVVRPASLGQ